MIIDIHLEVLEEYQRGDTQLAQKDFFEILVEEFMGSKSIKEEDVPEEHVSVVDVQSSDSAFREEDFVPKEQVPSSVSGLGFREEDFVPKEDVRCSYSGFREEDFVTKEEIPKVAVPNGEVPCSDSGFREDDSLPKEGVPKEQVPMEEI
ncbi:SICA antigen [Plasmodium coatneyi]|uniref:SICA antigen n=1 Tax=Plasmodium coatneyi TaxID=208452 RepID=A0A1B1DU62_9APIC|nr:SICA antigen [Plasmodium coatneyi]ANQ06318.1 SICA antigen [Plasmodium coatneyi]